ncbi:MAG: hypothetical protein ACYSR6_08350 [Planctomycetota bacterium]|jgi:hypothetical protein
MKAKIQIAIGLSTALAVSVVLIIMYCRCSGKGSFIPGTIPLIALLGAYSVKLIQRRTKTVRLVFLIWCTVWILGYLTLLLCIGSEPKGYLISICVLGGWPAVVLHYFFGWGEDIRSAALIAPVGFLLVTFLMWIGIHGMGQLTRTTNEPTEEGEDK